MSNDVVGKVGIEITGDSESLKAATLEAKSATADLTASILSGSADVNAAYEKQVESLEALKTSVLDTLAAGSPIPPATVTVLKQAISASGDYAAALADQAAVSRATAASAEADSSAQSIAQKNLAAAIATVKQATTELAVAVQTGSADAVAAQAKQVEAYKALTAAIEEAKAAGAPIPAATVTAINQAIAASGKYTEFLGAQAKASADAAAASEKQIPISGALVTSTQAEIDARDALVASYLNLSKAQVDSMANYEKQIAIGEMEAEQRAKEAEATDTAAAAEEKEAETSEKGTIAYNAKADALAKLNTLYGQTATEVADLTEILAADDLTIDQMQLALGRTVASMAEFRAGIAQVQAAGLPVPEAANVALEKMQADIAALRIQLADLAATEEVTGAAGADMAAKIGAGEAAVDLERAAVSFRGLKLAAVESATAFLGVAGPILSVILIIGLLPLIIDQVVKGFGQVIDFLARMRDSFADWSQGVQNATVQVGKHAISLDDLTAASKKAADAEDRHAITAHAVAEGLIAAGNAADVAAAETDLLTKDVEHGSAASERLADDFKKLGIVIPQTSDEMGQRVEAFMLLYQKELAVNGPAYAEIFAEANKKFILAAIDALVAAGKPVPKVLQDIADSIGVVGTAMAAHLKEIEDNNKALSDSSRADYQKIQSMHDLIDQLDNEREKAAKTTAQIIASAAAETAAIKSKSTTAVADLQKEIDAIVAKGRYDEADTNKLNDLMHQQTVIRSQALADQVRIDTDSTTSVEKVAADTSKQQGIIKIAIGNTGAASEEEARKMHDGLDKEYTNLGKDGADAAVAIGTAVGSMVASSERLDSEARTKIKAYGQSHITSAEAVKKHQDAHPPFVDAAKKAGKDIEADAMPPIVKYGKVHSDVRSTIQGMTGKDLPEASSALKTHGGAVDELAGKYDSLDTALNAVLKTTSQIWAVGTTSGAVDNSSPEAASTQMQGPPGGLSSGPGASGSGAGGGF